MAAEDKKVITEHIEWCNYWFEDMDDTEKPRLLLIGDSISNAYRPEVAELMQGTMCVDGLHSSRGLDNPDYTAELKKVLEQENLTYQVIHFNNGLHAWHLTAEEYGKLLEATIGYIVRTSRAKVILATSTPVWKEDCGYDNERNRKVEARNKQVLECATAYGLAVNDLYRVSAGRTEYRSADGVHYNQEGSMAQAEQIVRLVTEVLS